MLIQIILLIFIGFVFLRIFSRIKRKEITLKEGIFWSFFWVLVGLAVLFPKTTDLFAKTLGVGRGADLLVYLAVIFLFYLVFRIFVHLEKIERNITKIIRKIALEEKKSDSD
jgi:hypothetical protein